MQAFVVPPLCLGAPLFFWSAVGELLVWMSDKFTRACHVPGFSDV